MVTCSIRKIFWYLYILSSNSGFERLAGLWDPYSDPTSLYCLLKAVSLFLVSFGSYLPFWSMRSYRLHSSKLFTYLSLRMRRMKIRYFIIIFFTKNIFFRTLLRMLIMKKKFLIIFLYLYGFSLYSCSFFLILNAIFFSIVWSKVLATSLKLPYDEKLSND